MTVVLLGPRPSRHLQLALSGFDLTHVNSLDPSYSVRSFRPANLRSVIRHGQSVASLIETIRAKQPSVVVMMERDDTRNILPILFRSLPHTRFISVQSAWFFESAHLHLWWPGERASLRILTWGQYMIDLAAKQGRDMRGRHAVGSLESALFASCFEPVAPRDKTSRICLVVKRKFGSVGSRENQQSRERRNNVERLVRTVFQYCEQRKLEAVIPQDLRRDDSEREGDIQWLTELGVSSRIRFATEVDRLTSVSPKWLEPTYEFDSPSAHEFSALSCAATSALVTGTQNSAVIWQSIALGFPTLSVGYGQHPFFTFPISGSWSLHDPSVEEFSARADTLIASGHGPTDNLSGGSIRYLINQSPVDLPIQFLRQSVAAAVENKAWSI